MGGQTATSGALHIDMRSFNRILEFSVAAKTITVQAGITWREIQERIDTADLSVKVMQSYANFTVGGAMSVNAHGRYVGLGPLIGTVKAFRVVLADGSVVRATPHENPDLFYGVIGGYGGLGIITEVTLDLSENVKVKRDHRTMGVSSYRRYFFENIRNSREAIFHNANLYPGDYAEVDAVTYAVTNDSLTITDRLVPANQPYRLERFMMWAVSDWPFGWALRRHVVDPLLFAGPRVTWRNYEASYDVAELEPSSRETSTFALQEYFIPVERFDEFVPKLRTILQRSGAKVINISIRHSTKDPGSLLAWARHEVFAFVLYFEQGTSRKAQEEVGVWTRDLIGAALEAGGAYYLPYQLHATRDQFLRAYPRAPEFFALKAKVDSGNKFRNELWNKYGQELPKATAQTNHKQTPPPSTTVDHPN